MIDDYSGFYYNKSGPYENIVYYISPMPEQQLYLIRKYNIMLNTNNVIKSIETGYNGYDYEIYKVDMKTRPVENPENDEETIVLVDFTDFSNQQVFEGVIIIEQEMPMYDRLYQYIYDLTRQMPILVESRDPKNKLLTPSDKVTQQSNKPKEEVTNQTVQTPVEAEKQPVNEAPVQEEALEDFIEEPMPKTFDEQLKTPQQRAIEDSATLAFQIVKNNEEPNNSIEDNNNQ